jgi:hypothetical protein
MKSSLLSRKVWAGVFAIVLMLGVTVMPLSASAANVTLGKPSGATTTIYGSGNLTCITRLRASIKPRPFVGTAQVATLLVEFPENASPPNAPVTSALAYFARVGNSGTTTAGGNSNGEVSRGLRTIQPPNTIAYGAAFADVFLGAATEEPQAARVRGSVRHPRLGKLNFYNGDGTDFYAYAPCPMKPRGSL